MNNTIRQIVYYEDHGNTEIIHLHDIEQFRILGMLTNYRATSGSSYLVTNRSIYRYTPEGHIIEIINLNLGYWNFHDKAQFWDEEKYSYTFSFRKFGSKKAIIRNYAQKDNGAKNLYNKVLLKVIRDIESKRETLIVDKVESSLDTNQYIYSKEDRTQLIEIKRYKYKFRFILLSKIIEKVTGKNLYLRFWRKKENFNSPSKIENGYMNYTKKQFYPETFGYEKKINLHMGIVNAVKLLDREYKNRTIIENSNNEQME